MPRGGPRPGSGRPKGSKNRLTPERKAFLRDFIDGTQEEAIGLWREMENPADKFKLWLTAAEYCYPKLARTELTGADGKSLVFKIEDD